MEKPCTWCELGKITTKEALLCQSHVPCYRSYQQRRSEFETISGSGHSGKVKDVEGRSIFMIVFYFSLAIEYGAHTVCHEDALVLVDCRFTCLFLSGCSRKVF
jgi:hypothetical protein